MKRLVGALALVLGASATALAGPTVGPVSVSPSAIAVGQPTAIIITAQITDPSVIAGSVNVQRLDAAGKVVAILGTLRDDGLAGDVTARDQVFTCGLTINQPAPGQISLRVSAAFKGLLKREMSHVTTVAAIEADAVGVIGPTGGTVAVSDPGSSIDGARVYFPPGSVSADTVVTIRSRDDSTIGLDLLAQNGFQAVSPEVNLEPSGLTFSAQVRLTMPYDISRLPTLDAEPSLHVVRVSDQPGELADLEPTDIDTVAHEITVPLVHFSPHRVATQPPIPLFAFKWGISEIKYYIGPDTPGHLWGRTDSGDLLSAVKAAVESWAPFQGQFSIRETVDRSEANVVISAVPDLLWAWAAAWVPGYGYKRVTLGSNDSIQIDVESSRVAWSNYYKGASSPAEALAIVIRHEVGHALGLAHNGRKTSSRMPNGIPAMWVAPNDASTWDEFNRVITGDDVAGLQSKYGRPSPLTSTGLIAHFPLDNGSADDVIAGRQGATSGVSIVADRNGAANGAMQFTSTASWARIALGATDTLKFSTRDQFTASVWVNADRLPLGLDAALPFGVGYHQFAYELAIYPDGQPVAVACTPTEYCQHAYGSPGAIVPGVWNHLALRFDGSGHTISLFVNGTHVSTNPVSFSLRTADAWANIGSLYDAPQFVFLGRLDDVRVYDRLLSNQEIQVLGQR